MVHRRRFIASSIAGLAGASASRGLLRAAASAGPSLRTPLCRQLGIEFPIFSVGFSESALTELASAVSRAGGCGVLGASRPPPEEIRRRIRLVRAATNHPFGVNVIIQALANPAASAEQRAAVHARVAAAIAERAPVLVLFWGDPAPFVAEAHRNGVKVFVQVGDLEEARAAKAAGVDAVIAQGIEAGGHVKGRTSVWELLPTVVDALAPLPVLASGGIGDGGGSRAPSGWAPKASRSARASWPARRRGFIASTRSGWSPVAPRTRCTPRSSTWVGRHPTA